MDERDTHKMSLGREDGAVRVSKKFLVGVKSKLNIKNKWTSPRCKARQKVLQPTS